MKINGQLTVTAVLSILSLGLGCQTMRSDATVKIPATETPQDEALSNSVRERLLAVQRVDLSGIKAVSSGGTVYLTGRVKSLDARQQALKITWNTPGVKSVVNSLEVQQ